jgi:hypothetical protein
MTDSSLIRRAAVVLLVLVAGPRVLSAQNSAFGVLGIGFPIAPFGVVARSMGGGPSVLDGQSSLNPAALARTPALSVEGSTLQEFRNYSIGGVAAEKLKQNRFPYLVVTSPLGPRFSYGFGFSEYAERTYDVTTSSTLTLRGLPVGVTDRVGSSGAIVDLRAAVAWASSAKFSLGAAGHVLGGSAKISTTRTFADSIFRSFSETVDATFKGFGVSAGFLATPVSTLKLGGSVRLDTRLSRSVASQTLAKVKLPKTVSGGFELRPTPVLRLAGTVAWRSWGDAATDLAGTGSHAFNTLDAGFGIEIGGAKGGPPVPLRLGIRRATLPFSPTSDQPHEITFTAGTGLSVANSRAQMLFAVERAMRDGAGVRERSWELTFGLHIRP